MNVAHPTGQLGWTLQKECQERREKGRGNVLNEKKLNRTIKYKRCFGIKTKRKGGRMPEKTFLRQLGKSN